MLCAASLFFCGLCAVLQAQQVQEKVTGVLGKEVTLPCSFTENVTQVMWARDGHKVAVYSPQHGTHYPEPDARIEIPQPTLHSAALRISRLRATDEGEYVCDGITWPHGNRRTSIRLGLQAPPQNSAEAVPVVAGEQEVTVATCTSANGRPPSQVTWQSSLLGNVSTILTNHSDGTSTTKSHYRIIPTWTSDGERVTCAIRHQTAENTIPVVLSVQYSPVVTIEGYDNNWHLNRNEASLTCKAKGNPPPTVYTWKTADGSPLPSSVQTQGNVLFVKQVDERVNTTFLCEVTNAVGSRATQQEVLVREKPNTSGAGTTGGIIGGIIAAIVGLAVFGTVIMICRQQRKNQTAKDEELEGPPAYKPPPPALKLQAEKAVGEELLPLKVPVQLPETTEEFEWTPPPYRRPPPTAEEDYLEQINPIYNELSLPDSGSHEEGHGFIMSPAVYV